MYFRPWRKVRISCPRNIIFLMEKSICDWVTLCEELFGKFNWVGSNSVASNMSSYRLCSKFKETFLSETTKMYRVLFHTSQQPENIAQIHSIIDGTNRIFASNSLQYCRSILKPLDKRLALMPLTDVNLTCEHWDIRVNLWFEKLVNTFQIPPSLRPIKSTARSNPSLQIFPFTFHTKHSSLKWSINWYHFRWHPEQSQYLWCERWYIVLFDWA